MVEIIHPKIFMIPCVLIDPDLFLSRPKNEAQIQSYACRQEKKIHLDEAQWFGFGNAL